jgi:hypothetical protein
MRVTTSVCAKEGPQTALRRRSRAKEGPQTALRQRSARRIPPARVEMATGETIQSTEVVVSVQR